MIQTAVKMAAMRSSTIATTPTAAAARRGVFVLFEGVDRCGKTTQTRLLRDALAARHGACELMHFPDRSTSIGQAINAYLSKPPPSPPPASDKDSNAATASPAASDDMDDHVIHLLFAANRWEAARRMEELLARGVNLVVDRYSFSGVAFSSAKEGMDLDWCWQPEVGLPKPDAVIFLEVPIATVAARNAFGVERYETSAFQQRVAARFQDMRTNETPAWHIVDAAQSIEDVHRDVLVIAEQCIAQCGTTPVAHFGPRHGSVAAANAS